MDPAGQAVTPHRIRRDDLTLLADCEPSLDRLNGRMPDAMRHRFGRQEQLSIPAERVSCDLFRHAAHRTVAAYWAEERDRRRGIPRAEWFDPVCVAPALGYLLLLDAVDGGSDFRYRVYGTRIANIAGFDHTGKRVSELPEPAASVFQVQYGAVADLRAAVYAEHDAPSSISSLVRWCRLALPLSDDEDRIRRLLVVNVPVDRSR